MFPVILALAAVLPAMGQNPKPGDPPVRLESAILWTQSAGEWRALCYQGWNIARMRLDEAMRQERTKKPAVVVDIDETVLDNSAYHAQVILSGAGPYPRWADWINSARAVPIPGALEFLNYAVSRGVDVFYITNRNKAEEAGTLENLRKFNFPRVDLQHVLVRTEEGSKERRRQVVAETHDILLLCGDNLNDFVEFARSVGERNVQADALREQFGVRFIVFPNAFCGDWESALYHGVKVGRDGATREELRRKNLRPANLPVEQAGK